MFAFRIQCLLESVVGALIVKPPYKLCMITDHSAGSRLHSHHLPWWSVLWVELEMLQHSKYPYAHYVSSSPAKRTSL